MTRTSLSSSRGVSCLGSRRGRTGLLRLAGSCSTRWAQKTLLVHDLEVRLEAPALHLDEDFAGVPGVQPELVSWVESLFSPGATRR